MKIKCPKCQKILKLADTLAGKKVRCPSCQQAIVVPQPRPKAKPAAGRGGLAVQGMPQSSAHQRILNVCAANGISCMSLIEPMNVSQLAGNPPYFDKDIHWTSTGHSVAAKSIEAFIHNIFAVDKP